MTCTCGHAIEEHGHDVRYPGSTACSECNCIAYEADEAEEEYDYSEEDEPDLSLMPKLEDLTFRPVSYARPGLEPFYEQVMRTGQCETLVCLREVEHERDVGPYLPMLYQVVKRHSWMDLDVEPVGHLLFPPMPVDATVFVEVMTGDFLTIFRTKALFVNEGTNVNYN